MNETFANGIATVRAARAGEERASAHPDVRVFGGSPASDERARAVATARRVLATAPAYDPDVVVLARQFLRVAGVPG